jgi:DNA replication protein DnaC
LITVDLLLFDEMGASRPSPWVEDNIYYVINKRYNGSRITVFASNFFDQNTKPDEETLAQRIGERIRSRLYEMADSVDIRGLDYREQNG